MSPTQRVCFGTDGRTLQKYRLNALDSLCKSHFGRKCIFVSNVMLQFRQSSCLGQSIHVGIEIVQAIQEFLLTAKMSVSLMVPMKLGCERTVAFKAKSLRPM